MVEIFRFTELGLHPTEGIRDIVDSSRDANNFNGLGCAIGGAIAMAAIRTGGDLGDHLHRFMSELRELKPPVATEQEIDSIRGGAAYGLFYHSSAKRVIEGGAQ